MIHRTATEQIDSGAVLAGGLDHSLVSGMAWTAILRWSAQIISWMGTFYAARLLKPADYGLVAMAMLAIGLARMVEDFGMDAILVQDRAIVGGPRARLAGLLLALGVALSAVFALAAQPIAWFFDEPRLVWMVVALHRRRTSWPKLATRRIAGGVLDPSARVAHPSQ